MASLVPGYEYDIFISYRQKDNKYDGWVTEFVDHLKREIDATFKEDISIYFDENPSDGLLETHIVDESLVKKLKCLIFIPIISQTYCDSKSYAWQHEFCSFNRMAKEDRFGRDISLGSGNISSRILPVKIHDLDPDDKLLLENEIGGFLRSIDFIYKSAGVNRPLRANEEHPQDNLNKTFYRDQINKVANAVKEIITALRKHYEHPMEELNKDPGSRPAGQKHIPLKIVAGSVLVLVLMAAGYFLYKKIFRPDVPAEKSVAVLPFANLSNDPEQEYFAEGVVEAILTHLYKVGDLKVVSSTSTKKYKNTDLSIKEIARDLGVASILEGSVQKTGNEVRITAQLIDAATDVHLWSEIYDRNITDIFSIQSEVARNVAKELKATLTIEEKEKIEKIQTGNADAYNMYLKGRFFWGKRTEEGLAKSVEYFEKAIEVDSGYTLAYAGLADAYFIQAFWGWIPWKEGTARSMEIARKALEMDHNLAEGHAIMGELLAYKEWNWEGARKELKLATELNPNFVTAHHYYSELLDILRENTEARKQINLALELDPYLPVLHMLSGGYFYYNEGKLKESLDELRVLDELDPDYNQGGFHLIEFYIYASQKEGIKAAEAIQKAYKSDTALVNEIMKVYDDSGISGLWILLIDRELKRSHPNRILLARWYSILNRKDEALNCLTKEFENPRAEFVRINCIPDFDNIRTEPGFQAIIRKMGLTAYQTPE